MIGFRTFSLTMVGGIAGLVLAEPALAQSATPSSTPSATLTEKLGPSISEACRSPRNIQRASLQGETGFISASALGQAIYDSEVATLKPQYEWNNHWPQSVARAAFSDDNGVNADALHILQRLVETWLNPSDPQSDAWLPYAAGGVRVHRADGGPVSATQGEAVLLAILSGDDAGFKFGCALAATESSQPQGDRPTSEPPVRTTTLTWVIAQTPDDLALPIKERDYGEFAYADDREAGSKTYSVNATLGLVWGQKTFESALWTPENHGWLIRSEPSAFVQIEREGGNTTQDPEETNNLNFGLQTAGYLQTRSAGEGSTTRTHYFALNARYLTDDEFRSQGWSVLASVTPDIRASGFLQPKPINAHLQYRWLVSAVADYESVEDPGLKTSLQDSPRFGRIGFDAEAELRFVPSPGSDQAFSVGLGYKLREDLNGARGDADLFTASIKFEPSLNYAIGLTFKRGDTLDSLEAVDQWNLTLGVRR